MQKVFLQQFGGKMPMSAILSQMSHPSMTEKGEEDDKDQIMSKVGVASGTGPGVVGNTRGGQNPVQMTMIHMCTRKKLGRMMIFSVYKDQIGQNIYLRVVMLDPVWHRETHLTVLGHATQSFLDHLRINRDMIEAHRAELGRLVVANTFLVNKPQDEDADLTNLEPIDDIELPDADAREYVLRLKDVIATTNSYDLPSKRQLLDTAHDVLRDIGEKVDSRMSWETFDPNQVALAKRQLFSQGRHLQIAVYGDTTSTDMLSHSHNIRVKVADAETLQILTTRDLHEDVLEPLLAALGQRQLICATREQEMAELLLERILLQYDGYEVSGVQFSMPEGDAL